MPDLPEGWESHFELPDGRYLDSALEDEYDRGFNNAYDQGFEEGRQCGREEEEECAADEYDRGYEDGVDATELRLLT